MRGCQNACVDPGDLIRTKVVGVTFCEGYPQSILRVEEMLRAAERVPVRLVRDPSNSYDSGAINVVCVAAGGRIGRLSRERAARLAPALDAGEIWNAEVESVLLNTQHPDKPGVLIRCWRTTD
jgi:hypothetical protein